MRRVLAEFHRRRQRRLQTFLNLRLVHEIRVEQARAVADHPALQTNLTFEPLDEPLERQPVPAVHVYDVPDGPAQVAFTNCLCRLRLYRTRSRADARGPVSDTRVRVTKRSLNESLRIHATFDDAKQRFRLVP